MEHCGEVISFHSLLILSVIMTEDVWTDDRELIASNESERDNLITSKPVHWL